jgi:hypothetical protein
MGDNVDSDLLYEEFQNDEQQKEFSGVSFFSSFSHGIFFSFFERK